MKRKTLTLTAAAAVLALGAAAFVAAPTFAHGGGYGGQMGQGYGHGMMGQGMGPGMMGNHGNMGWGPGKGHGFGPGMKGQGNENCPRYGQQTLDKELSVDDVKEFLGKRLEMRGNGRLKVGKVEATGETTIVAEIVTVDDSLVRKVEFDTKTGAHKPIN